MMLYELWGFLTAVATQWIWLIGTILLMVVEVHRAKHPLRPILSYVLLTFLFAMAALVCGVILGSMIS